MKILSICFLLLISSTSLAKSIEFGYTGKSGNFKGLKKVSIRSNGFFINYNHFLYKKIKLGTGLEFNKINSNSKFITAKINADYVHPLDFINIFSRVSLTVSKYEEKSSIHNISSYGTGYQLGLGVNKKFNDINCSIFYGLEEIKLDEFLLNSAKESFLLNSLNISLSYNF